MNKWHHTVTCMKCRWPFHCPVEQQGRVLCLACESFIDALNALPTKVPT